MKKLNVIFLVLAFAVSLFIYSCSASGKVSVNSQQNGKTVRLAK
jgi:hypothetical protein